MKSYPYFVFPEDYGANPSGPGLTYTSHRIAFFTKKTGAWEEKTVVTRDSALDYEWRYVTVANNGSLFVIAAESDVTTIYTSSNEGNTWTEHLLSPTGPDVSASILVCANGLFGIYDYYEDGWWTSSSGTSWTFHAWPLIGYSLENLEWTHVSSDGRLHVLLVGDNRTVYYTSTADFVSWTTPTLLYSADGYEGMGIVSRGKVIIALTQDWRTDSICSAVSPDNGATWTTQTTSITSFLGAGWGFDELVISNQLSLLAAIIEDDLYISFMAYNNDIDAPNGMITAYCKSEDISLGAISWSYEGRVPVPFEYWWFAAGTQDPVANNGWHIVGGYSYEAYTTYWGQYYSRKFEEIDPLTQSRTLIYSLLGNDDDVIYDLPADGAASSRVVNGWFTANCYRVFPSGYAYLF